MAEDAEWKAIDALREQQAIHAQAIAVIKHEQETQRRMMNEQHTAIIGKLSHLSAKIDVMAADFHEARGGIRFGKWLGGMALTLLAIGVSVMAYFKGAS